MSEAPRTLERFSPSVLIDGYTVEVEGWMIILAFAIRGIPWAIDEIKRDEPAFKAKIADYFVRRNRHNAEAIIKDLEGEIARLKFEM